MARAHAVVGMACAMVLGLAAQPADADDLPIRKPGLWEMKVLNAGSPVPKMAIQHCTDETTDKSLNDQVSPLSKQACSKQEIKKTSTGYVADAVCNIGRASIVSHTEIVGDFNSAYTVNTTSHSDKGPGGKPLDTRTAIEAKWLGACKSDQKPGDIMMPGGLKMNVKDMEKLKALIPGAK
jgi:Protein of unknown function (DUF3617)